MMLKGNKRENFSSAEGTVDKDKTIMELRDRLSKKQQPNVSSESADKLCSGKEESFNSPEDKKVAESKGKSKHQRTRMCQKILGGLCDVAEKFSEKEQSDESSEDDNEQSKKEIEEKKRKLQT